MAADRYSIQEARKQLPRLVDRAEGGHPVEITRQGKPVAVLLSIAEYGRLSGSAVGFGRALRAFLELWPAAGAGIGDDFLRGTRARSTGRRFTW